MKMTGDIQVYVSKSKLDAIASRVVDMVLRKNADYGDAWQRFGIPGIMSKLSDKLARVEMLADGRQALVAGEDLEDSLLDAIGYSMLGLLYLEEKNAEEK